MSTRAGRALAASLVLAAAFTSAWLVPLLAPLVVWPVLLVVPGWALTSFFAPRIDTAGRLGLSVVMSVAISTHLVYWISHVGGYGREAIFAATAALALPIPYAAWHARRRPRLTVPRPARPALIAAAMAALVVGVVLGAGIWRVSPEGVSSGGSNWSDLGVHLSIAETLNAGGNFPPQVPYFAGVPLVYHWFADFHAAILAEAALLFSVPAMVVQSGVLAGALALIVHSLTRRLLRVRRARRLALIATILAVFGGGLGYLRFIGDIGAGLGSPLELVARNSYDNQWLTGWPYFRIPSVMGTGLLAHRATTAGLPMLVGAVLLLVAGLPCARRRRAGGRDRPGVIALAGLLGSLLAPFHFFFFPVVPLLALAWAVAGGRAWGGSAPRNALAFLGPYLLALPFVVAPALQAAASGSLQPVGIWPSAPREDGPAALAFFYLTNLGVPFGLAVVALLVPRLPHRGFLAAWLIGLFLVPNLVQLSVIDFDMNKYFQAMWIAAAMLAAWLVHRWPLPAVAAVLALSLPSPLLVAGWTASSDLQVLSRPQLEAARWIAANTSPEAVFVTDGWVNSPTDAAGRMRLTTFGPYVANLGYRPDERIADVLAIYCGGDAGRSAELMRRYGASHLLDGARPQPCGEPVDFSESSELELVYDAGPLIWRLTDP